MPRNLRRRASFLKAISCGIRRNRRLFRQQVNNGESLEVLTKHRTFDIRNDRLKTLRFYPSGGPRIRYGEGTEIQERRELLEPGDPALAKVSSRGEALENLLRNH